MNKIEVLDKNTIDKIAAGEVVERPASVVKELVENAIDAGATAIAVEIKDGGSSFIRITDNGSGIEKNEVKTAFLRHATSKIRSAEDLLRISSLGFRGEALSSISAVSQVELITKTAADFTGSRYRIEGGNEIGLEEIGAPEGTTFLIRNLFYNVPARKKFLKANQTEAGYISDLMERMALSRPDISFKFINNNQTKLQTSGNTNLKDIIYHVYGRDITANLIPVDREINGVRLSGFIGKPIVSRGNRNFENYFVNGRYVKSNIIARAIEEGYKGFVMQHKYPFTALHLTIDGKLLDVNVHPTKMELRISNQEDVFKFIYMAVNDALNGRELIPVVSFGKDEKTQKPTKINEKMPEPFEVKRLQEIQGKAKSTGQPSFIKENGIYRKENSTTKEFQGDLSQKQSDVTAVPQQAQGNIASENASKVTKQTANSNIIKTIPEGKVTSTIEKSVTADAILVNAEKTILTETNSTISEKSAIFPKTPNANYLESLSERSGTTDATKVISETSKTAETEKRTFEENATAEATKTTFEKNEISGVALTVSKEQQKPDFSNSLEATLTQTEQLELFDSQLLKEESRNKHKIIGQLFKTYWLVEFEEKLFIVDQHAAHEKVLYERNMKMWENKEHSSQLISPPLILTLSNKEEEMLHTYKKYFEELGFEIEHFGGKEYSICAIPMNLYGLAQKDLFIELIDDLENVSGRNTPDMIREKLASMSCKAAVKGNQSLSYQEMDKLMDELLTLENPYNCPHGRPTIISMSKYELEKKFKRIV